MDTGSEATDLTGQVATAADGRTLSFAEWGDPHGQAVFSLHGTPGCRLNRNPHEELIRSAGVRLITYDRAGYGRSDRHRGRVVADDAADVAAIADHLGIGRFSLFGGSGGGPHALAAAALLGDRIHRAACVVGVAPYDALGADFFTGMDPENVKEFGYALDGEERLTAEIIKMDQMFRAQMAADPGTALSEFDLPDADREVMARPEVAAMMREVALEQTRNGVWGWVDDDLAFTRPWGFDPATIAVPIQIWYGTKDVLVPPGHGEWLARTVPGAEVKLNENGHLGDPDTDLTERLAWLTAS
ncbi:MAG TPA: alpha/beta hydrolase [Streptosporangiaceae bacterium]|nr:alpha/beta hydrolase [Streptosporangiaceae bacterium]